MLKDFLWFTICSSSAEVSKVWLKECGSSVTTAVVPPAHHTCWKIIANKYRAAILNSNVERCSPFNCY